MTRVLSELLGAREPAFRLGVRQLEQASGLPNEDIRLTTELNRAVQDKVRELGLDPLNTTGEELYHVLHERVRRDNRTLEMLLGDGTDEFNLMPRIERLVEKLDIPKQVFALKASVAKKILKAHSPKRVMKQLGYRSLDSMLKHESPYALFAAARIAETPAWHKALLQQYKKLTPTDFEVRAASIIAPTGERWEKLVLPYVQREQHTIVSFRELGSIILLPFSNKVIDGAVMAATLLTLQALNDLRVTSTYLKLHQVRPDFGDIVAHVALHEPVTHARLLGLTLPWKLLHHYFARHNEAYNSDIFEPHIQLEDLAYQPIEKTLASLHPTFAFWDGLAALGLNDQGKAVSLNPLDAVINFCNHLPYEQRIVRYLRDHLWRELMLRYMHHGSLEQRIHEQLSDELVEQAALN